MSRDKQKIISDICQFYKEYGTCKQCNTALDIDDEPCYFECMANAIINNNYRKQEWISVEERLPESDGDFLVWSDYYGVILGHYFARGRYFISKAVEVTHWMPLPDCPNEKGGEG